MGKFYTDQERYKACRKLAFSGDTISEFVRKLGINRTSLMDWVHAYRNINGKFINVSTTQERENQIISNDDVVVNRLSEVEKAKRRNHFDRLDHLVVEIEFREMKITTYIEQAAMV